MKINPDFIMQNVGGEIVMVPTGNASRRFRGVIRMNKTAAYIAEMMKEEQSKESLIALLAAEYEGSEIQFAESVDETINVLREAGAIIE